MNGPCSRALAWCAVLTAACASSSNQAAPEPENKQFSAADIPNPDPDEDPKAVVGRFYRGKIVPALQGALTAEDPCAALARALCLGAPDSCERTQMAVDRAGLAPAQCRYHAARMSGAVSAAPDSGVRDAMASEVLALMQGGSAIDETMAKFLEAHTLQVKLTADSTYQDRRAIYETVLTRREPAPSNVKRLDAVPDATKVTYPSGTISLPAWLAMPAGADDARPVPAIVYLHEDFALEPRARADAQPFVDAGFAVLFPTFRGENGNPGHFEMFYGEVDDAAHAIRWLADQPGIDSKKIYAFGHLTGGAISALLSLRDDLPLVHGASCDGLIPISFFHAWEKVAPFDLASIEERDLRTLLGHQRDMKKPHAAYVESGVSLDFISGIAELEPVATQAPLVLVEVPAGRDESLRAAIRGYIDVIQKRR